MSAQLFPHVAGSTRFELALSGVTSLRATRLRYDPNENELGQQDLRASGIPSCPFELLALFTGFIHPANSSGMLLPAPPYTGGLTVAGPNWSGRLDSNERSRGPRPRALPGCATPREIIRGDPRVKGLFTQLAAWHLHAISALRRWPQRAGLVCRHLRPRRLFVQGRHETGSRDGNRTRHSKLMRLRSPPGLSLQS